MNSEIPQLKSKDKHICACHFLDMHIQKFIIEKRKVAQCDYCEETRMCQTVPKLAGYIEDSFKFDYGDPFTLGIDFSPETPLEEYRFYGIEIEEVKFILDREIKLKDYEWEIVDDLSELFRSEFLFRRLVDVKDDGSQTYPAYLQLLKERKRNRKL